MNTRILILLVVLPLALSACDGSEPEAASTVTASAEAGGHSNGAQAEHDEEAAHEGGGHIELSAEQLEIAGVKLAQVGPASIREVLPLYGVVAPNAERVLEVAARFPGLIRGVNKKVGDAVRQGETLATVESNESLQSYAVVSPLSGVITARNANPGEQTGDRLLFTVADLSTVWVELSLFPRDVAKVRVDQSVRVKSAEAKQSTDGKIVYVAPFGQSANQTLTARVLLDNAERRWAPGLYVTAEVTLAETQVPLALRNEAVQMLEERSVVFIQGDKGFAPRPVRLGRSDGEISEVLAGAEAGETYATRNSFILKAELGKGEAAHED